MAGVDTVYLTYWMRYPRGDVTWAHMIDNVARMAVAASAAGVRRFVYFSVTNARHDSSTAYFRAKAAAEEAVLGAAGGGSMSAAIIRPTLLYGPGDILINNMAWTLRRLPIFGIPGDGRYRVQPVHVDDVADLAITLGNSDAVADVDAAGPDILTFNELVGSVRAAVRSRAIVTHMPTALVLAATRLLGTFVRDEILTGDEIRELSESLLVARDETAACPTRFTDWIAINGASLGRTYSSEMARNFRLGVR